MYYQCNSERGHTYPQTYMHGIKKDSFYNLANYYSDILYKLGVYEGRYLEDVSIQELAWSERVKLWREAKRYAQRDIEVLAKRQTPKRVVRYRKLTRSGFVTVRVSVSAV